MYALTTHTHTPTHKGVAYRWVFAERLHFPFEQQWNPAGTPARRPPRILATACRSEGGPPSPHDAAPSDPACPRRSPANTNTCKDLRLQSFGLQQVHLKKNYIYIYIYPTLETLKTVHWFIGNNYDKFVAIYFCGEPISPQNASSPACLVQLRNATKLHFVDL